MKKFTIFALAAVVLTGSADAKLRWNPEGAWSIESGKTILAASEDNKTVVNKLNKLENGNWRNDIRYAGHAVFNEDEPYLVVQITTDGCAWNLNDYKFEFMLERKLSEGLNEDGSVKWGNTTETSDPNYPSFWGDKLKVKDQYEADLYQILGSKVVNGNNEVIYTEDVIVIDLNKVRSRDKTTVGELFKAGDVDFPNYNAFQTIVEPDANGMGGVQQRSWFGFVCIAPGASVTVDQPTFTVHYTGTVADSSDALMVCEDYANGEGGQEVREGDDESGIADIVSGDKDFNVYMRNGKSVVANGAALQVYTADGKLVKSGMNEVELESGLYIVKATKDGKSKSVKALVK